MRQSRNRQALSHLNPQRVIHPDDDAVISKMNKIPGFQTFLKQTVGRINASITDVTYVGNAYDITLKSYPELYRQLKEDCLILGLTDIPLFSIAWEYFISSRTVGQKKYRIVMTSGSVDLLTSDELDFLIGHEIGHIRCGHIPYHMLVEAMYMPLLTDNSSFGITDLIRLPMLEWYRISHYTADRMGLLCCQDINIALSTMIKMSGLPKEYYDHIDIESFVRQADEFDEKHSGTADKMVKALSIMSANSPWLVVRVKKLMEWYRSGSYQSIINHETV